MTIEGIKNYVPPISGAPATAGQPTESELRELAAAKIEVIVNLGLLDPRYCLEDEAGLIRSLGMSYHHLPVDFDAPSRGDLWRFFDVLRAEAGRSILVHCAANYRATCFVALFAEAHLGWTRAEGDAYIARVWAPNEAWKAFLRACRNGRAA